MRKLFEREIIAGFNRDWCSELLSIDVDMVWVGKGAWAVPELWRRYKENRPNTKLVCYNADDPVKTFSRGANRPWVSESIPCFDLYCTYKPEIETALKAMGAASVAIIPFAWDPQVHPNFCARDGDFQFDIVFVGNGDPHRVQWLEQIVGAPQLQTMNIGIFGNWSGLGSKKIRRLLQPGVTGKEMAERIARSRVSLNILRKQNETSHNMRTFETPGSGGVNVSLFTEQQNSIFPKDEASYYFSSVEDSKGVLFEAVRDEQNNARVRERAFEIVRQHTYLERAKELLDHLP